MHAMRVRTRLLVVPLPIVPLHLRLFIMLLPLFFPLLRRYCFVGLSFVLGFRLATVNAVENRKIAIGIAAPLDVIVVYSSMM